MEQENVTMAVASEKVDQLGALPLHHDQPCIGALSLGIQYSANLDTNFEDRDAFISEVAKFMEQATVQANLNNLLEEEKEYAVMLYTWRSCSRAVPPTDNDKKRKELYATVVEVLEPYVQKLRDFKYFQTLGKIINMLAELDELKNMKASVKNDYSAYRRAKQFLHTTDDNVMDEPLEISMFLATQNSMCDTLKSQLVKIKGYEELLVDLVNISMMMFEKKKYLTPAEKYMLVKVMALTLFLMDTDKGPNIYQMNEKKRINLTKIDQILKQTESVPVYGDLMFATFHYIKKGPNFDPSKWPCCESSRSSSQHFLVDNLPSIREQHHDYMSNLSYKNGHMASRSHKAPLTREQNQELAQVSLKGLQLLSEWTQLILEMYSWKVLNPTRPEINKECPVTAEGYEKAVRYNFNGQEKSAVIEVIAMIKGLQVVLARLEPFLVNAIHNHIYTELQEFVQKFLREPIRRATKKKNDTLRIILLSVRDTCVDWLRGVPPAQDPAISGKKDPVEGFHFKVPQRNVGPSSTQLYMVRTMLESLIDERRSVKNRCRKQMDEQHVTAIEQFLESSFTWHYLLNLNESLFSCCDLSQLWFREFFLEHTMGNRIQFPIEMSLPWILTDYILETKEPSMMEYILYPLDLYNDSAQYALMVFKKQFFYDEIEAEVNLCFDQFVYKLSDQIFAYYKHLAGCVMLDKRFRAKVIASGEKINFPVSNKYKTLLKQHNLQILGRSIDLKKLIGPSVNVALQKALDIAITRFEAGDITGIIELEGLIEVNRLAHKLMSKYLLLNDFDAMLKEADHIVTSPHGRITLHVFWEINKHLLPNYCYNSSTNRFVKTTYSLDTEEKREKVSNIAAYYVWGTKRLNHCFSTVYSLYSGFVGSPHFQAMCRLLGYLGIAIVIEELIKAMKSILTGDAAKYVKTLKSVMPDTIKLLAFGYGSAGAVGYFEACLADFIQYSDLRIGVFQTFTEIGNAVIFCLLLEQAMNQEEVLDLHHAALFKGDLPKPYISQKKGQDNKSLTKKTIEALQKKYAKSNVSEVVNEEGTKTQILLAVDSELLTSERLCCGLSIFGIVLKRISAFVNEPLWKGELPSHGVMNVESCTEFHRLWSAIQFVYCIPTKETEFTIEEMFGEGLNWAGCTIIALLGQHRRFELLDFCYHLSKIFRVDMKNQKAGLQVKSRVDRIRKFQILNDEIFTVLNKYLKSGDDDDDKTKEKLIHHFSPPEPEKVSTYIQMFGDGLNWAGCTLIALLGQEHRFELLDFCYHLLKVNRVDMKNETVSGIELKKMVDRIRKFQLLNSEIFSCLNKFLKPDDDDNSTVEQIYHFSPPVYDLSGNPGAESSEADSMSTC